ncbi:type II toxin-antitoxin system Phd/YefM family antitoxin [Microlunatus sp. GCM10028923]|uniref:type II toxin-antitoxin system Phd/YefM family antitoxin n=1 Tax=Microlunatus sp. GCM10028923 TaxID=3273400 RepID=UPI0036188072
MTTVNIHEAKTQFSKLVERAARGETIMIARAGRPLAKLTGLDEAPVAERRLGFLAGQFRVPDDFDELGRDEIADAFGAG